MIIYLRARPRLLGQAKGASGNSLVTYRSIAVPGTRTRPVRSYTSRLESMTNCNAVATCDVREVRLKVVAVKRVSQTKTRVQMVLLPGDSLIAPLTQRDPWSSEAVELTERNV